MSDEIDLTKCDIGQVLLSRHGLFLIYLGRARYGADPICPYLVQYPNGSHGTRTKNGLVSTRRSLPTDHDIIVVLPTNWHILKEIDQDESSI